MNYIDICTGISACTVAWKPMGWKAQAYAEIDSFPSKLLAHHYPTVPNVGDFIQIKGDEYGAVDVLVGGTPCQDFSVAGLGAGMDGQRGQLTVEFAGLAGRLRPRWLVWENVPGVLSIDGGRAFGTFLGLLGKFGYGFAYRVLDAQHFGVPQRRRRVFVVGYLGDWRRAAAVLFERQSLSWDTPPRRENGQGTSYDVALCLGASGRGFERIGGTGGEDAVTTVTGTLGSHHGNIRADQAWTGQLIASTGHVSHCLNAGGMGRQDYETETLISTFTLPTTVGALTNGAHNGGGLNGQDAYSGRIIPWPVRGQVAVGIKPIGLDEEQNAVVDGFGCLKARKEGGGFEGSVMTTNRAVRRLTPRECERLQGFPDDYTKISDKTADAPRYKALGNSMAVPVMRWIGERIQAVDAI